MNLKDWLAHCEKLHPHNIDMGLERVRKVAQRLDWQWACPVVTVAGTNGKGSTCAMIEVSVASRVTAQGYTHRPIWFILKSDAAFKGNR